MGHRGCDITKAEKGCLRGGAGSTLPLLLGGQSSLVPTAEAPGTLGSSAAALEVGAAGPASRRRWPTAHVQLNSKYACFLAETTVGGEILDGGRGWGQQNGGGSEII